MLDGNRSVGQIMVAFNFESNNEHHNLNCKCNARCTTSSPAAAGSASGREPRLNWYGPRLPWDCRATVCVARISALLPKYRHCWNSKFSPENPTRCMKFSTYSVQGLLVTGLLQVLLATFLEIAEMYVGEARWNRKARVVAVRFLQNGFRRKPPVAPSGQVP